LAVQTEVLESHIEKGQEEQEIMEGRSVVALAQAVAEARETAEASQSGVRPSYEKLLGRVEAESTTVYEIFESVKKDASEKEVSNVERRLADIERKIARATDLKEGRLTQDTSAGMTMSLEATSTDAENAGSLRESSPIEENVPLEVPEMEDATVEDESIALLRSALTDIQKLLNYMTHIDVRENVSIEELVPLTLTPEEKQTITIELLDTVMALQTQISLREVPKEKEEKVSLGLQELEIKISAAVASVNEGSYEVAHAILKEAQVLAFDLDELTKDEPLKSAPVLEGATTSEAVEAVQ
jgi:hypothetical protein